MLTPDKWAVVEITDKAKNEKHRRIFSAWTGNFFTPGSSRVSSPIVEVEDNNLFYEFTTQTGSKYHCYKSSYFPSKTQPVENDKERVEILQTYTM